jgi:hypothetical protein
MELIGSLLLVLAVALVVAIFVMQPFLRRQAEAQRIGEADENSAAKALDHQRSTLLAERDQVLTALQELDFDHALGKVPEENYVEQRALLLKKGADALRRLDEMSATAAQSASARLDQSVEERIEAAVAARRADSRRVEGQDAITATALPAAQALKSGDGNGKGRDSLEDLIATRKRERKESTAGFCPKCGRPVSKSDKFCSRCGSVL